MKSPASAPPDPGIIPSGIRDRALKATRRLNNRGEPMTEIDDKTKQALAALLDYVGEEEEWEDYQDSDPGRQANHIYRYFETVRSWLGPIKNAE
jgi:hypothetical protein